MIQWQPTAWQIPHVTLSFDLDPMETRVCAQLEMVYTDAIQAGAPAEKGHTLVLNAADIGDLVVSINAGEPMPVVAKDGYITLYDLPHRCVLVFTGVLSPATNHRLEGLYTTGKLYCTQCEAEGFQRIAPFLDRPDVLSSYRVTIKADQRACPVLLAGGNPIERRLLANGKHQVTFEDPFPKPCYLFAIVAGDLAARVDKFETAEGRMVDLAIYADHQEIGETEFAMASLKRAMLWDEQYYGRCFDHDRCSIVAVNDFNAGAMENKGLNVFNAPYVLISSETATDRDLQNVESVIAHEYFHNWTGNRITLRDWLQLSLKEGLTVYREQHYMQTMHNAETSRLGEAQLMRAHQFPEDASPLAHPVRPTQFARIDNLYTVTVYEKGAEVIRMLSLILGKEGFGKGMDTYFARYDGKAVTCEDFLDAHASANSRDLMQFARWYRQVGTPRVLASVQVMPQGEQAGDKAEEDDELRVVLTLRQLPPTLTTTHPATPESLVIPQLLAFYDKDSGTKWEVTEASCAPTKNANFQPHQRMIGSREEWLFVLHDWQQSWHIRLRGGGGAKHQPLASSGREPTRASIPKVVVSLNRWFSAPIHATQVAALEPLPTAKTPVPPQDAQLGVDDCDVHLPLFRLQYDDDPIILVVARDAVVQAYARAWLSDDLEAHTGISHALVAALRRVLHHDTLDDDAKAAICQLPSMDALDLGRHDVVKLWHGMAALEQGIGLALQSNWISTFESRQQQQTGGFDAPSSAMRALSAVALRYACAVEQDDQLAARAYAIGKTMTDRLAAMSCVRCDAMNSAVFADFLDRFGSVPRCLDKWFGLLARSPYPVLPGKVIARLEQLTARPDFDLLNPNRVYAVVRGFAEGNLLHFHAEDGSGYRFLEQKVRAVAAHNPQLAARLATSFGRQHLLLDAQRATLLGVVQQLRDDPSLVGHAEVMDILGRIS